MRFAFFVIGALVAIASSAPTIWWRISCNLLNADPCSGFAHPAVVAFWASHRNAWLGGAFAYAIAGVVLFRTELLASSTGRRVIWLFLLAACTAAIVLLLE